MLIAKGLGAFIPSMVDSKDKKTANPAFTDDDLRLLFNSKHYVQGKFRKPVDYWMPLLGLFTGARGNELAFLFKEDIRKHPDNDIWYIYIRRIRQIGKRTKSPSSIRSIPIHPQLKKIGFLKYVDSVKEGSRIFPELKESKKGDYYQRWGNSFNRYEVEKRNGEPIINKDGTTRMRRGYMTQCGVEKHVMIEDVEAKKSFKSFRHMMINYLDRETTPRIKNFITGHKYKNESVEDYIHPDNKDLREALKALQKLKFPSIDWNLIRKRRW